MWPRNLSGVGTVADAGRWSTSSVEMRGSDSRCLISDVYSASCFCAVWAAVTDTGATAPAAAIVRLQRQSDALERDILLLPVGEGKRTCDKTKPPIVILSAAKDLARRASPMASVRYVYAPVIQFASRERHPPRRVAMAPNVYKLYGRSACALPS